MTNWRRIAGMAGLAAGAGVAAGAAAILAAERVAIGRMRLQPDPEADEPLGQLRGQALTVLADPTRRKVFERLRAGPRPVNALAAGLPVSRPAVSQHLRALKDAGLVEERSEGVRRIYSLRREGLTELRDWLDTFWDDALAAFKEEAEKTKGVLE